MAALTWVCMVFMILQSHPGISSAHRVPPASPDTTDKPNNLGRKWEWQAGGGGFQIGGGIPGLGWGIIHGNNGNPFFAGCAASGGGGRGSPDYGGLGGSSTSGTSGCTGDGPGGGVGGSGSGGSGSIRGGFFIPGLGYGSSGAPLFCVPPLGCYYGQYGSSGYGATDDHGNYDGGGGYGSTTDDHGPYTSVSSNLAEDRSNGYDVHHKDNREIYGKALSSRKMKRPNHGANGHNAAHEHYVKALSSRKMKRPNHGANGHNAVREHASEPIASAMAPESD